MFIWPPYIQQNNDDDIVSKFQRTVSKLTKRIENKSTTYTIYYIVSTCSSPVSNILHLITQIQLLYFIH